MRRAASAIVAVCAFAATACSDSAKSGITVATGGGTALGSGGASTTTSGGTSGAVATGGASKVSGSDSGGMSSGGNVATGGVSGGVSGVGGSVSGAGAMATGGNSASGGAAGMGGSGSGGLAGMGGVTLTDSDTLIPDSSWDCGLPQGIPPPSRTDLVFEATAELGEIYDLGETQYGHRLVTEIKGGTVTGPMVKGTLMDRGLDYQLTVGNGAVELEELNIIQTSDGVPIFLRTCGAAPASGGSVRTVPDFEAPNASAYAFLNTAKLVGTRELDVTKKTLKFSFYQATSPAPASTVTIVEPRGVPDQTWECKVAAGTKGAVVYSESVGIGGGSVAVGASKRGTRNIIPITGGTTTGKIAGSVLSGGADYQIIGTPFTLDARYTLHTGDGEYLVVRNCGPLGGLVPVFETRKDGPYAFMNANTWLSSDPSIGAGVVNLTIYDGGK